VSNNLGIISYKKQFALMSMLLITFLAVVELGVNVWLNFFYQCDFEENEIFRDMDPETKRKICLQNIGNGFAKQEVHWSQGTRLLGVFGGLDSDLVYINSNGFRTPEFIDEKPQNTYRIFTLGGSTTFGVGVLDNQTYSHYLQEFYNETNLPFDVEVINTGWPGKWSFGETILVKTELLDFNPDLFIVYDGWNDLKKQKENSPDASSTLWKERWKEICNLGNQYGFDVIITLHPIVSGGNKILTEQEHRYAQNSLNQELLEKYPEYFQELDELKDHCTVTENLIGIFDNNQEPIFFDQVHVGPLGNQIIAKKFYQLSLPIAIKKMESRSNTGNSDLPPLPDMNFQLISHNVNSVFDEYVQTAKQIIAPYKTPRIFSLIFQ